MAILVARAQDFADAELAAYLQAVLREVGGKVKMKKTERM
jgi:hypothetical protein